jgi:hypothetical protein
MIYSFRLKRCCATFWAIFLQTHLVILVGSENELASKKDRLQQDFIQSTQKEVLKGG